MRSISQILFLLTAFSCNSGIETDMSGKNEINQNYFIQITWDTTRYLLNYCSAKQLDSVLHLTISNFSDTALTPYELNITKGIRNSQIQLYQTYAASDCLYVTSYFKTISQTLQFDRPSYKKGDKLSGRISLILLGHKAYSREPGEMKLRENFDTVRIDGRISSTVK